MDENIESGGASEKPKKRRRLRTQVEVESSKLPEVGQSGYLKTDVDVDGAEISKKKKKRRRDDASRSQVDVADGGTASYQEDGTVVENQDEKMDGKVEKIKKAGKRKRQNQSLPLNDELNQGRQTQGNLQTTDKSLRRQLPPAPAALAETQEIGNAPLNSPARKKEKQTKRQSRRRSSVGPQSTELDEFVVGDYGVSAQDIIPGDVNEAPLTQLAPSHPTSQLVDRVFVEKEDGKGFVSQRREMLKEKDDNLQQEEDLLIVDITTSDFAIKSVNMFRWFAFVCHGLAAGLALWQCVVVYQLDAAASSDADFLSHYENTGQVVQSLYYFLLAVCCVSALESYESTHAQSTCNVFRKFQLRPSYSLSVIVYVVGLVVSLAIANTDYRIHIFNKRPDLWTDVLDMCSNDCLICTNGTCYQSGGSSSRLTVWRALSTVRAVCAILGWLLVSSQVSRTHTPDHLFPYQSDISRRSQLDNV